MTRSSIGILAAAAALCVTSCNAAVGAAAVVVLGGVGYFATQCYDRVQVRVLDPATGRSTCDADVSVADAEGSERRLRPCYSAALTEGTWRIIARRPGYVPASTELTIGEREGSCPYYTHSIELTLRREGEPVNNPGPRSPSTEPAIPRSSSSDLESPPARVVPPPIPGVPKAAGPVPSAPAAPAPAPAAPPVVPAPQVAPPPAPR
jgi:hypothetical protein